MDHDVTLAKLESLERCLRRLEVKRPEHVEELTDDLDRQDILAVNLERAVQLCVDLAAMRIADGGVPAPETMGEAFAVLRDTGVLSAVVADRMMKAVAFRNIAVHAYRRIDWEIVFAIVHHHLEDFRAFSREILESPGASPRTPGTGPVPPPEA
ncbi:MAG: DUF86 domain-containing protein [Acidobacteria bacterium]|nr:DUF86 domain-containing protein [Acidobacteriota bacterium]